MKPIREEKTTTDERRREKHEEWKRNEVTGNELKHASFIVAVALEWFAEEWVKVRFKISPI